MSTHNGLADLLFGRTRGAILALLYGEADQSFYTRQIAREVDARVGAVQRTQQLYQENDNYPWTRVRSPDQVEVEP
jgi:hypothetical protein